MHPTSMHEFQAMTSAPSSGRPPLLDAAHLLRTDEMVAWIGSDEPVLQCGWPPWTDGGGGAPPDGFVWDLKAMTSVH